MHCDGLLQATVAPIPGNEHTSGSAKHGSVRVGQVFKAPTDRLAHRELKGDTTATCLLLLTVPDQMDSADSGFPSSYARNLTRRYYHFSRSASVYSHAGSK